MKTPHSAAERYRKRCRRRRCQREVDHEAPVGVAEQAERGPVQTRHCASWVDRNGRSRKGSLLNREGVRSDSKGPTTALEPMQGVGVLGCTYASSRAVHAPIAVSCITSLLY